MELKLDKSTPFSLNHSLSCGQVFRWCERDGWWYGVVDGIILKIRQEDTRLFFHTHPKEKGDSFIKHYFRLDDDLPRIISLINRDAEIDKSIQEFHGLRIIRQTPWEGLISYICATNTSIPRIKDMIYGLAKRFGKEIIFDDMSFYTFPEPEELAYATLNELNECGLGYRARYVLGTSGMIEDNPDLLKKLGDLSYEEARDKLLSLPGVGLKVADCVSLFSLGKLQAFPVDVWVRRVMYRTYLKRGIQSNPGTMRGGGVTRLEYEEITSFAESYFGKYAGYAQEYLFYYMREHT